MVKIDQEVCVGCGKCAEDCLAFNIEINEKTAYVKTECIQCGHCVAVCPVGAVSIPEYDMEDVETYDEVSWKRDPEQVLRSIKARRSIRSYRPEKIKREELEKLLQAGRYTATAKNNQDCFFVFVQEEREVLKEKVWKFIEEIVQREGSHLAKELIPYAVFNRRRKADPKDDYLFRNAPAVLFITSDWPLDAGLAAQNVETMAEALGIGTLYNGYLARIAEEDQELKQWMGIEGKTIKACMLLGYPDRTYLRTAPRKKANVIWK